MDSSKLPLVSILVVSYNSSSTIIETLDSAYSQSYSNVELVISDDCSSDDTIAVCKSWIETHKERFIRCKIITTEVNTGIPSNLNRGISNCSGKWIKEIAADDILLPDCVEKCIDYVLSHEEVEVLFSSIQWFSADEAGNHIDGEIVLDEEKAKKQNEMTSREQYLCIIRDLKFSAPSPSVFYKKSLLSSFPYTELYKGYEDTPHWTKLTRNGIHLSFMGNLTVKYRRGNTVSHTTDSFFPDLYWQSRRLYFWRELRNYFIEEGLYDEYNKYRRQLLFVDLVELITGNKVSRLNRFINRFISIFVFHMFNFPDVTKKEMS